MEAAYPRQYLYRRVVKAKLHIDKAYASNLDLSSIAGEACFSKFHFSRLFKVIYGKTPHQYLTDVRINRAKELLAAEATVAGACFSVGFDSISSFTGLFRRRVGLTPAAFQRAAHAKRREMISQPLTFVPNCFVEKRWWNE